MDSRSDDCRVSRSSQAAVGSGEEADAEDLTPKSNEFSGGDSSPPWGDDPCFTEAELNALLPPIPDWARKPPGGDKQPTLF